MVIESLQKEYHANRRRLNGYTYSYIVRYEVINRRSKKHNLNVFLSIVLGLFLSNEVRFMFKFNSIMLSVLVICMLSQNNS